MIRYSGLSATTWILRILVLISVVLITACENDEIIKPQAQSEPTEPPLPVREWFPSPKHRQQPTIYMPVPATQQPPAMAPPHYQGNVVQQPWGIATQQPVYSAPQPVYQSQPPVNQQQPTMWSGQQPVVTWPQSMAPQYQYYAPRPWGTPTQPDSSQGAAESTDTWPQGSNMAPWGWGTQGTGNNSYWVIPGQTGQPPGAAYYGSVW